MVTLSDQTPEQRDGRLDKYSIAARPDWRVPDTIVVENGDWRRISTPISANGSPGIETIARLPIRIAWISMGIVDC